ncbi:MAG TPA: FkbM family methyltransferase [Roseiflexaceae bacterium]|nr:FkbM family methyltransferase [Roseiflexaceae bacterium]
MLLSRWIYYLSSIPTLLRGVRNVVPMLRMFLPLPGKQPFVLELHNGLAFRVRSAMDIWVIKETCLDRDYEQQSVLLGDDWTVLDIGAGLGDFAIHAAHHSPRGTIYAYEPSPDSYALLQENIALNEAGNIRTFHRAVGSAPVMTLATASGVPVRFSTAASNGDSAAPAQVQVQGISLDAIFETHQIAQCDYLKIDCEGAEYDIFFTASPETLRKIRHISLEYHNDVTRFSYVDLMDFFVRHGFTVTHTPNPAHTHIGFLHAYRA